MANVRLVLSGGSARGILEAAGAVNALADRGHEISVGAGTSAGGIIMGALAAGRAPKEIKQIVLETDFGQFISTGWRSWWRLIRKGSLSDGKALLKFLKRITRDVTFKDAIFDVRIVRALLADRGLPGIVIPAWRLVVMAHKETRLRRQFEDPFDRVIELTRITTGKVATRGTEIGHE